VDPILGEYLPTVDRKRNKYLPGMGGVFKSFNLGLFSYVHLNPLRLVDPDGNAPNLGALWQNYNTDGQAIIKEVGGRLSQFEGENTCAIKMSHTFNLSGEPIPSPKNLPKNIRAISTDKGNYIFGSSDMGRYFEKNLGEPNSTFDTTTQSSDEIVGALENRQGLIHFAAGDSESYGASGHVDLLGPQGPDVELKGSGRELGKYLMWNKDAKLKINFWDLEGGVPDQRGVLEKAYDYIRSGE
jgi:hypothetical protein